MKLLADLWCSFKIFYVSNRLAYFLGCTSTLIVIQLQTDKRACSEAEIKILQYVFKYRSNKAKKSRERFFAFFVSRKLYQLLRLFLSIQNALLEISCHVLNLFQKKSRPKSISRIFVLQERTRNTEILGILDPGDFHNKTVAVFYSW